MREELFEHYLKFPFVFYDNQKTGTLMSHITIDLNNISDALHHIPEDILTCSLTIIGAFLILSKTNIMLSLGIITAFPLLFIHAKINIPKMKKTFKI
jgi:ATP-binding cassette subfamily B protein